jgi:hypothetical protein
MGQQVTKQEAEDLADTLRAELARTSALAFITVKQVVDNPVDSQGPYGWSVQLLNARTGNLPIYVGSEQECQGTVVKICPGPISAPPSQRARSAALQPQK